MGPARGLELGERATNVVQCHIGVGPYLVRALELMQSSHRLRDRGGQVDQVARHARIGLKCVESARQRLACHA
jgi:hypothetical protein